MRDKTMSEEKKELSTIENDVLAVSFLKQNGKSVQSPFSRDIFLLNTMINGAMHVEGIHKRVSELHEGERVQLILEPKNKYDDKAILVKNGYSTVVLTRQAQGRNTESLQIGYRPEHG